MLDRITVPTAVIVGNQDILTPRGDSEELADRIPTAELTVLSGAAHGLMIEHATTFNRVLGDFLSRAELAWKAQQKRVEGVRHLRAVPNAS
jgi:3-oxoadipate enol-lactonase